MEKSEVPRLIFGKNCAYCPPAGQLPYVHKHLPSVQPY